MRARSTLFTLYTEFYPGSSLARVRDLVRMMALLGFSEAAVRAALSRSAKRGWVLPRRLGRAAAYALSPRVRWQVAQVRRRLYAPPPPWEGGFWLLLPREPKDRGERERFRRELLLLGFASVRNGAYLGLGEEEALRELLGFYGLEASLFWAEPRALEEVLEAFPLEEALRGYRALLAPPLPQDLAPEEAFRALVGLVHAWRKLLFWDPGLPPGLHPLAQGIAEAREGLMARRAWLWGRAMPFLNGLGVEASSFSPALR